ncbi:hypothetical protein ADUPG1_010571 [Aduncisulcus paluster]|uniref:Uncharacterized protein n=1 Tax=Aduncisulcus paluster TaxID=2918883 RepID=A0ABQ5JUA9_9EUKA|nr:hypothetical protein ADUPG1_010571 [Aduncisulcus paluster]
MSVSFTEKDAEKIAKELDSGSKEYQQDMYDIEVLKRDISGLDKLCTMKSEYYEKTKKDFIEHKEESETTIAQLSRKLDSIKKAIRECDEETARMQASRKDAAITDVEKMTSELKDLLRDEGSQ